MADENNLEQRLEQTFQETKGYLPEDRYFKKIWDGIESRAPVGEKYYLRSGFSILLIFLLLVIFTYFYTDFLSSFLALKEIRRENLQQHNRFAALSPADAQTSAPTKETELTAGVRLSALESSRYRFNAEGPSRQVLEFLSGHAVVDKTTDGDSLAIRMPGVTVTLSRGRCNIFCYDGIVRVIPLLHESVVETDGVKQTVKPGQTFYLLDGRKSVVTDDV